MKKKWTAFLLTAALACGLSAASLEITRPNTALSWPIGRSEAITWNYSDLAGQVKLTLYKDGARLGNIARNRPITDRSFAWTVGSYGDGLTAAAGGGYQVRISLHDREDEFTDTSAAPFSLTAAAPPSPVYDFALKGLFIDAMGLITVKVVSKGRDFIGDLQFKNDRNNDILTLHLGLPKGVITNVPLWHVEPPLVRVANPAMIWQGVTVNPNNEVNEVLTSDNYIKEEVFFNSTYVRFRKQLGMRLDRICRGDTYTITPGACTDYPRSRRDDQEVKIDFYLFLANVGYNPITRGRIKVWQVGDWQPPGSLSTTHHDLVLLEEPLPLESGSHITKGLDLRIKKHPSQILIKYLWPEDGYHTPESEFAFFVNFSGFEY